MAKQTKKFDIKHNHRHQDGSLVEMQIVGPLVQFLTERGLGSYFCFEELRREPNREFGILHLYTVADRLPAEYRQEAHQIIDLHLETTSVAA